MARPKRGLGKGLDALFIDNGTEDVAVSTLAIGEIEPNADQPRREFSPEALSQLAESYLVTQLERGFSTLDFYKTILLQ